MYGNFPKSFSRSLQCENTFSAPYIFLSKFTRTPRIHHHAFTPAYLVVTASHVSFVRGNWNSCGTDHWFSMIHSRGRDKNRRRGDIRSDGRARNKRESVRKIYRFCAMRHSTITCQVFSCLLIFTTCALRYLETLHQNYYNCGIVSRARKKTRMRKTHRCETNTSFRKKFVLFFYSA